MNTAQAGIETGAPQGAHAASAARGARRPAVEAQDGAQAGGFAALLAGLGQDAAVVPETTPAEPALPGAAGQGADDADASGAEVVAEGTLLAMLMGQMPGAPIQLPAEGPGQKVGNVQGDLAWPGGAARGAASHGLRGAAQQGLDVALHGRPGADTLVGETALLDAAQPDLDVDAQAALEPGADRPGTARRPARPAGAPALPAAVARASTGTLMAAVRDVAAAAATLQAPAAQAASGAAQPAASTAGGPRTDVPQVQAATVPPQGDPGMSAAAALSGAPESRPGAGPASPAGAGGPGAAGTAASGAEGIQPPAEGGLADPNAAAVADPAAAEAELAEQVSYWVHQGLQNAALTLERDGAPVHVQVSLAGNEAHVSFHSDEAQARQMLDAGTAELRALLQEQGLQLAGMTVGAGQGGRQGRSGAGGEDGGDNRGARQGVVRAGMDQSAPGPRQPGRGTAAERSVDIFV